MNLLIVEDERMTREGLIKSLDWPQVGVTKVFSAENGEAGVHLAKRVLPDIVLTDIRMPRMDGITMATRIREILPECRIVFLSAYSQIDYYKAAIDLNAIRYLDKPVEAGRLRAVISEAVAECMLLRRYKSTRDLHLTQEKQKFADAICIGEPEAALEADYTRLGLSSLFKSKDSCTAVIISFRVDFEGEPQDNSLFLASAVSEAVPFPNLYTVRHKSRIVLLIFTPSDMSDNQMRTACKGIKSALGENAYTLAAGKPSRGLGNANKSYASAKTVLAKAYLYPWGEFVRYSDDAEKAASISTYSEEKNQILHNVSEGGEKEALLACDALYRALKLRKLKVRKDLIYNKARELYYEIIYEVFHKAELMHLSIKGEDAGEVISWIVQIENYNLDELHEFLSSRIALFFSAMEKSRDEKKQVLAIKNYIAKNYTNSALSISDISGYLHMSASHVCTMFKKATDDTINNYLTEFRLNKAKQYLRETLFTVAEISAKVGYSDSSYFGRIFRKHFGMTPNDFRSR